MGRVLANVLTGAWRASRDATDLSEDDLSLVIPLLYKSGDAALAWWRIRHTSLASSPTGKLLHDAYRHLRLAARLHEQEIRKVVSLLRNEGVEPVLVKGWAVARMYPDSGLRPYGDIDLCVAPDQFHKGREILKRLASVEGHFVDLHYGFTKLHGLQKWHARHRSHHKPDANATVVWNELYKRSRLVDLGEDKIRVLSDEDHLRVLSLHLLRSGSWRPLWLCDVALVLEARTPGFDWNICLGQDKRETDWIACTIGLAHQLFDVDVENTPVAERARNLPRWLVPAVLRQWSRCRNSHAAGTAIPTLLSGMNQPRKVINELYVRWDNPVRSTAALRQRFNNWPRWPYQLAELITHSPELPRQLGTMLRRRLKLSNPLASGSESDQHPRAGSPG